MGVLGFFKGKDPLQLEEQGDRYFDASAFGQAKLEYESALGKRRKDMPGDVRIPLLQEKILRCREALAREHKQRGNDLAEAGHFEDAREYYALALDLTEDADLVQELEDCRKNMESRQAEEYQNEPPNTDEPQDINGPAPAAVDQNIAESEEEFTTAVFNALPDDIRDAYLGYGPSFKNGFIALHKERFDIAVDELTRALEEHPEPEGFVRFELATAYLNLKHFEEARVLLEEFITHHPDDLPAYRMLCEAYWEMGGFDRAQTLLASLSDDQTGSPDYCLLCGETLFRSGENTRAESLYRDFLRDYGWNGDIAQALARSCEANGDLERAHELYGKIMESCGGCGARVDPLVKRKYADLSMATGRQNEKTLEIYLSLAEQDPANAAGYYHNVSRIYADLGHEKESQRFHLIALKYEGGSNPES